MEQLREITPLLSVTGQIQVDDIPALAAAGFSRIINNRPDSEAEDQPRSRDLEVVIREYGMDYVHIPVTANAISDEDVANFSESLNPCAGKILAFCRTGNRSCRLWGLSASASTEPDEVIQTAQLAGYDLNPLKERMQHRWQHDNAAAPDTSHLADKADYDVVIVGGGAAGCSVAASLFRRNPELSIVIIEPSDKHYYQPGYTLVGAGVFQSRQTARPMANCIPPKAEWVRQSVIAFEPERNQVVIDNGDRISYRALVVCPGLTLNWAAIEGCEETLGKNGVTSNYRFDLAPYTWQLVQNLKQGQALFTQPPMPIKCAGAPQKAMYLSCDWWQREGVLDQIQVDFCTATPGLFGIADFVPPLMRYVERYKANLHFKTVLTAVDGPAKKAWFKQTREDGSSATIEKTFDLLHLVPPQKAPDCVANSALANADGWVEVDASSLTHPQFSNVFSLGDVAASPNAKTAAAVRKQTPVVASHVISYLKGAADHSSYDGYGACPLTVERGKVIMAEFGYGGKLKPTLPLDPTVPRWLNWELKVKAMPVIYFDLMLKGREWFL